MKKVVGKRKIIKIKAVSSELIIRIFKLEMIIDWVRNSLQFMRMINDWNFLYNWKNTQIRNLNYKITINTHKRKISQAKKSIFKMTSRDQIWVTKAISRIDFFYKLDNYKLLIDILCRLMTN